MSDSELPTATARNRRFQEQFRRHVDQLDTLVLVLPHSTPFAKVTDPITSVFHRIPDSKSVDEKWEIFNRRMDILYGENLREEDGSLPNILRGPHGIPKVLAYLKECKVIPLDNFEWEATTNKVVRIFHEVQKLIRCRSLSPVVNPESEPTKAGTKRKATEKQPDNTNSKSKKDKDYVPPKRKKKNQDCEDDEPIMVIDSDGNEVVEESERMKELELKRRARQMSSSHLNTATTLNVEQSQGTKKKKGQIYMPSNDIGSGEESDGNTALTRLNSSPHTGKRGPQNSSTSNYFSPKPVVDDKKKKWEFKCQYCALLEEESAVINALHSFLDNLYEIDPSSCSSRRFAVTGKRLF